MVQIEEAILSNQDKAACIIIETIQAEGGDNHFRDEFLVELRRILRKKRNVSFFDEVQTGIGITKGKNVGIPKNYSVVPDVISGKSTGFGILANKTKLDEVEHHCFC